MTRNRLIAIIVGLAAFIVSSPAWAHVTVSAPGATRGGVDQIITFRVPNESGKAASVELQVSFPSSAPIASVDPQPHPGWTVTTTSVKLAKPIVTDDGDITDAVSTVTWKAGSAASGIPVGQFDQFSVIAGLLPDVPSLTFPAIQTYSDGTVVKWIESAAPGSTSEPDHPAPELSLAAATTSGNSQAGTVGAKSKSSSTTGVTVLAIIALVLALGSIAYTTVRTTRRD